MVTINQKDKPKILTESDRILNSLRDELAGLKMRMNVIEEEQEQNRHLLEQLTFQKDLANELMTGRQEEIEQHTENYRVIAHAIHDLKTPVTSVVDNLAGILSEIDDPETKQTLKDCMDTASNVLNSFDEVEGFCLDISSGFESAQKVVKVNDFFKQTINEVQSTCRLSNIQSLRLKIDKALPNQIPMYTETLKACLSGLLQELNAALSNGSIVVRIAAESNDIKYGVHLADLVVHLEIEPAVDLHWGNSWLEAIRSNRDSLLNSGLNLLRVRDVVRRSGGQVAVESDGQGIKGFKICLPLTY